jgi:hypothetical protein
MNDGPAVRVPAYYWVVSVLALIWTLIGVSSYLMQVYGGGPAMQAEMSDAQRTLEASMPAWVTGAFAISVFAGLLGSIGLLIRKKWAKMTLVVSLIAAVIQFGWVFFMSEALALLGGQAALLPVVILLVGAGLIWFADRSEKNGWLA